MRPIGNDGPGRRLLTAAAPRLGWPCLARGWVLTLLVLGWAGAAGSADAGSLAPAGERALDRIAVAVDGIESSHGADPNMWRAEPDGPQGPMQVSADAAADAGGGDRFDESENRALGRAYLDRLYRRYRDWPDAVAAYNWGPGKVDAWIGAGRPIDKLPQSVALYRVRVLFGSGLAGAAPGMISGVRSLGVVHPQPRRPLADRRRPGAATIAVEQLYGGIMRASEATSR